MKKNNQKINTDIFHAYDIRGIYPSELNEKAAYKIGLAFVKFLRKKTKKKKQFYVRIAEVGKGRLKVNI